MTSVIINVTTLALDNNRLRYTVIGSNPYQCFLLYVIYLMDNKEKHERANIIVNIY
jgi:hypothetical protein